MTGMNRLRRTLPAAVTASLALALVACGPEYPNTTFAPLSETATAIDRIWDVLLLWGLIVFFLVEAALIYIVWRYRHRDDAPEPKQIHGSTKLELLWTAIPVVILLMIAGPTVRTIFITQAPAPAGALEVEVTGHQWWWEFNYPELGVRTANELYLPAGRAVNISIRTVDVLHSFWIPRLAGKRDAVNRRTNHIWFTPDAGLSNEVFNGFCAEYCGASHANMQFRVFVLAQNDFASWSAHQAAPSVFVPPGQAPVADSTAAQRPPVYEFPGDRLPAYAIPATPYFEQIAFQDGLTGDPARGMALFNGPGTCLACHTIAGNQFAVGATGPNLTHIGSRTTIGGALYPNNPTTLARWIKNAGRLKPGSKMPTLGAGELDPLTGQVAMTATLTDQQIADIVAYLMTLK